MGQDRRNYRYNRIYIEATRILNPQFDSITIELTGAQVELLRNATMLFNSQDTFVDAYHNGYYMNASDADYDNILAIVADLEWRLMGGMNTLFGFNDVYQEYNAIASASSSTETLQYGEVPDDEVWVVTQWCATNEDTRATNIILRIGAATPLWNIDSYHPDVASHAIGGMVNAILGPGQRAYVRFEGCSQFDVLFASVAGYKMKIPA